MKVESERLSFFHGGFEGCCLTPENENEVSWAGVSGTEQYSAGVMVVRGGNKYIQSAQIVISLEGIF